jgi:hypothetical protein
MQPVLITSSQELSDTAYALAAVIRGWLLVWPTASADDVYGLIYAITPPLRDSALVRSLMPSVYADVKRRYKFTGK